MDSISRSPGSPSRAITLRIYGAKNSIDSLEDIVRAIYVLEVEDDGLNFEPQGVTGERISPHYS